MIYYVIIFLVLALVGLLTDWSSVVKKWGKNKKTRVIHYAEPTKPHTEEEAPLSSGPIVDTTVPAQAVPAVPTETATRPKYSQECEELLTKADAHFRKGEIKAAEELYIKVAAKDPNCSKAYSRLGVIYLEHDDNLEDAEQAFRQALKSDPSNGYVFNNLGLVLYHQDKYADAIRNFEQAVRMDEQNAARHANLGMAYLAMRQYAKAESSFKKALKLAPNELEYKDLLNEAIDKKKAHKVLVHR